MKKKLNVGVVGLGAFMGRQHLPNIAANKKYRFHTFCDLNEELLRKRAEEFKVDKCTTDSEQLFEDPEIDVIFVGTKNDLHAHFVERAIEKGKNVFVEKPMTSTVEETQKIIAVAKDSKINVGVGFNRRFSPAMIEARLLFQKYKKGAANIIYRVVDDHNVRPKYIFDMNNGGGHLLVEGCHIFDLLSWFLEEEPVEIYAAGPLETDNIVILKFSGGSMATMLCGGKGGFFYPKECMEVFCNRTTLVIDHFFELRTDGASGSFIKTFPLVQKHKSIQSQYTNMTDFYKNNFKYRPDYLKDDADSLHAVAKPLVSVDKGHIKEIDVFADAILTHKKYAPGVVDGARATICVLKGYESIRRNQPVSISSDEYGYSKLGMDQE